MRLSISSKNLETSATDCELAISSHIQNQILSGCIIINMPVAVINIPLLLVEDEADRYAQT